MRKYLKDPAIVFSIILVLFVLFLSVYPITLFYFTSYLSKPKQFSEKSWIEYYGEERVETSGLPQILFYDINVSRSRDGYIASLILVNATSASRDVFSDRGKGLGFPPSGMVTIHFDKLPLLCNVSRRFGNRNEGMLLRLLLTPRQEEGGKAVHVIRINGYALQIPETSTGFTHTGTTAYNPDIFLGYAKRYDAAIVINNATCRPYFECPATYLRTDNLLFLGFIALRYSHLEVGNTTGNAAKPLLLSILSRDFGEKCSFLLELARRVENGSASVIGEYLFLKSLSFMPDDQAWIQAFTARFDALFPFSYILLGLAVLIVVARIRKWL